MSLQYSRSQTICSTLFVDISIQSVMSLLQECGGLPLRLLPGILPVTMSFSKLSSVFLIRCPKYCSLLFTSIPCSCLQPTFCSASSLVISRLADYLKPKVVALMESLAVKLLNVRLFRLVHICEVTGVQTFVDLRDGVVHVITKVHHFFLPTNILITLYLTSSPAGT